MSPLILDQLLAGELDSIRAEQCLAHLRECAACAAHHAHQQAVAADFLKRFPAPPLSRPVNEPAAREKHAQHEVRALHQAAEASRRGTGSVGLLPALSRRVWGGAGAVLAAAAALVLWLNAPSRDGMVEPPVDSVASTATARSKGNSHIAFFVKRGGLVLPGYPGMITHPGDQVRFSVRVNQPQFLAVLSRDGAGVVSLYHHGADVIEPGATSSGWALPSSIELDDVLGEERVWAVFCDAPVQVETLSQQLRHTGALRLPDGCSSDELVWSKEQR